MHASRRQFLALSGAAGIAAMTALPGWASATTDGLSPMTGNARPIDAKERLARIAKAQSLMRAQGFSALLVESGSSLLYFTGIDWWRSERLTAAIIPAEGDLLIVTPAFEEPSIRESLAVPGLVHVWQEDESSVALIRDFLQRLKLDKGVIGIEETVRFFVVDGLAAALPDARIHSGASVVRGCRMIKSPAELALMQLAADIQIAAFRTSRNRSSAA